MKSMDRGTRVVPARAIEEGAGVIVHRTIGTPSLRNYDPFLLLDHFSSDSPDDYIAGFPSHPHRGFSTFTYMIDGHMEHKDSMGNTGDLGPGSAQWMKAASGIIHSEMPKQEAGLMRGFQLWINLPAANKMDDPEYQEYAANAFPVVETEAHRVKVLMGAFDGAASPIVDEITRVSYFDVEVKGGKRLRHQSSPMHSDFLYLFEGSGRLNGQKINLHTLITLGAADKAIDFIADDSGARFIFVSGQPINEAVVQHGPFVMNSREEIDQAVSDFQSNKLVRKRAWVKGR